MLRNGLFAASAAVALWSLNRALEVSVAARIERWVVEFGVSYPRSWSEEEWDFTLGDVTWDRLGRRYGLTLLGFFAYVKNDDVPADL